MEVIVSVKFPVFRTATDCAVLAVAMSWPANTRVPGFSKKVGVCLAGSPEPPPPPQPESRKQMLSGNKSTNRFTPSSTGVLGRYPTSRVRASTSAQVSGTSPGCNGSKFISALRPRHCSSISI